MAGSTGMLGQELIDRVRGNDLPQTLDLTDAVAYDPGDLVGWMASFFAPQWSNESKE